MLGGCSCVSLYENKQLCSGSFVSQLYDDMNHFMVTSQDCTVYMDGCYVSEVPAVHYMQLYKSKGSVDTLYVNTLYPHVYTFQHHNTTFTLYRLCFLGSQR